MDNKDIINAGAGYVAGNAITNSMIRNLRKYSEEHYACSRQKEFIKPLSELIEMRRNKYQPFYEKINREMPKQIKEMTAEQICSIVGVNLISGQELADFHKNKEDKENAEMIFVAIAIIGIIILCIVATVS